MAASAVVITLAVAGWVVGPFMTKIINTLSDYMKDQVRCKKGMKKELERLLENHPKIQAVVFAANQAQISSDQNPGLYTWICQLQDALDEVNDVLEYIKHKGLLPRSMEETKFFKIKKRKVRSMRWRKRALKRNSTVKRLKKAVKKGIVKITKRAFKRDPTLKRLKKAVKKLDKVSADVTLFILLLDRAEQQQKKQDSFLTRSALPAAQADMHPPRGCSPAAHAAPAASRATPRAEYCLRPAAPPAARAAPAAARVAPLAAYCPYDSLEDDSSEDEWENRYISKKIVPPAARRLTRASPALTRNLGQIRVIDPLSKTDRVQADPIFTVKMVIHL